MLPFVSLRLSICILHDDGPLLTDLICDVKQTVHTKSEYTRNTRSISHIHIHIHTRGTCNIFYEIEKKKTNR